MPNIITHVLFADDVLELLDNPELNAHKQLFEIGSNGPDILFFHKQSPRTFYQKAPLRKYGSKFHSENINAFYDSAIASISKEKSPAIKDDMIAYVCGHLCHWALDSTMHPYIYYRVGNGNMKARAAHHRFESILDALMLKMKRNETIEKCDLPLQVSHTTRAQQRAIARIYIPAIESIYNEKIPYHMISETLDNWNTMQKAFRDPHGRKVRFFQKLEKPLHLDNLISGYAVPNVPEDNYDVMNLLHKPWKNPAAAQEYTYSVLDLYEQAIHKAVSAISLFLQAVADPGAIRKLLDFINDCSYELDLPGNPVMVHFDVTDFSI